jgi:hypothetical protein
VSLRKRCRSTSLTKRWPELKPFCLSDALD